jgi:hypothetical protein
LRDSLGNSRVIAYWNQDDSSNPSKQPSKFGYGSEWTASEINSGQAAVDIASHGSHVTGIAAGNGLASGTHVGVAPEADIVFIQWYTKGGRDWKGTVADGVQYIFDIADSLNQPAVVNISLGAYWGSHDGKDPAALRIDSMLAAKNGRAVVCASGNSGNGYDYHLKHELINDTAFTWFEFIQTSGYDFNLNGVRDAGVFFEAWSDTADFKNLKFSIGADDLTGVGKYRGSTTFKTFTSGWNNDSLMSLSGNKLADVMIYLQLIGDRYWMVVGLPEPDSLQYTYRLTTAGTGQIDIWSCPSYTNSSQILQSHSVMSNPLYPGIGHMVLPDSLQKLVDSWACSPNVVTVGNYVNTSEYYDYAGVLHTFNEVEGEIFESSSAGPTRTNVTKPDVSAPGTRVFSVGTLYEIGVDSTVNPWAISPDGYHKINTGTSMASPVVAGIAALFFENCGNASNADFLNALRGTARQDSLTGLTPNYFYGYGKADAFNLLNNSIPKPMLNIGDTSVCSNVVISTNSIYTDYLWSNGSLNSFLTASNSGTYFARVDSLGCLGYSDSITVNIDPYVLPNSDITVLDTVVFCQGSNCELQASGGFSSYTWNGGLGNSQNVFASNTGYYFYYAEDADGCRSLSDTVLVVSNMSPPEPNIMINSTSLESDVISNSYNWYLNGVLIPNSNDLTYQPNQNGYYQVEAIHANGCSSISDSLLYNSTSVSEFDQENLAVYPNPSVNGVFYVSNLDGIQFEIFNAIGERVLVNPVDKSNLSEIDLSKYSSGVYYLRVLNSSVGIKQIKLLIP